MSPRLRFCVRVWSSASRAIPMAMLACTGRHGTAVSSEYYARGCTWVVLRRDGAGNFQCESCPRPIFNVRRYVRSGFTASIVLTMSK